MAVDLTVAAVPGYFGSMAWERQVLQRRAARIGPSAADYERRDTTANLAMGTLSLGAPFLANAVRKRVGFGGGPGTGRWARALVGTAAGAAVVTSVADVVVRRRAARRARTTPSDRTALQAQASVDRSDRSLRIAKAVAGAGAVVAIGAGVLSASASLALRFSPKRTFARRVGRDRGTGPLAVAAAAAGWDFIYYWNHRFMHESRYMWAVHVVHHSSEHYNLSVALRQPVADLFGTFVPYGLMGYAGIRPELVETARGINLVYQYWIHTDTIPKLGPAEEILNTASLHRVHHGTNPHYIDRNHGSILILWDRLFGTHQVEDEPVVYGLTTNINTFSPWRIATHEYASMIRDVYHAASWHDRLSFVFRGPGWAYERHRERAAGALAGRPGV